MGQKWIIDVLSDLQAFAWQNDLPLLANQLEQTVLAARAEIAPMPKGTPPAVIGDGAETGNISREAEPGSRT